MEDLVEFNLSNILDLLVSNQFFVICLGYVILLKLVPCPLSSCFTLFCIIGWHPLFKKAKLTKERQIEICYTFFLMYTWKTLKENEWTLWDLRYPKLLSWILASSYWPKKDVCVCVYVCVFWAGMEGQFTERGKAWYTKIFLPCSYISEEEEKKYIYRYIYTYI